MGFAFGCSDGEYHQICVKESVTRSLFTLTHVAGPGSFAVLCQINCWQILRSAESATAIKVFKGNVDMVGTPLSHAFPISITIEPSGLSSLESVQTVTVLRR